MKAAGAFRWTVAAAVLAAMLASVLSFRADAQSEYMRGDRMPYDAFDRLPRTDLDVSGGTIHVAFAPGEITLPKELAGGQIQVQQRPAPGPAHQVCLGLLQLAVAQKAPKLGPSLLGIRLRKRRQQQVPRPQREAELADPRDALARSQAAVGNTIGAVWTELTPGSAASSPVRYS